ncbi:SMP-30/gluconolactonase/LRE family protein [Acidianus sulfidivorans JP7]|uniref:SMP-30/gluconolactonase/LRE family protein n=1 Tax=Acidianus sulfidivorans JP7 TaxID=619593 RepID=A0A2U9IQM3_9CREN|nr:SMP-30/gluconolactonase/LRE family protein [Acidianus sulfidivorans]AWR98331.1 SMP-30/gluconolactonase/LRE family protein [Acidianus sulfidivorans JP7]
MEPISPYSGDLYEGPIWHPQEKALYWVNILAGTIHKLDINKQIYMEIKLKDYVSAISPSISGNLIAASGKGIYSVSMDGSIKEIYKVENWDNRNRFNDGKCDALGRFWIGTMNLEEKYPTAGFYVLDADLKFKRVLDNVTISNGLAWNSDNTKLYYIDTPTKKIFSFDFDLEKGKIDNRKIVIDLSSQQGSPDGMTIDSKGNLWVAMFGGSKVLHIDPKNGDIIDYLEVPTPNVTSVMFGGENLSILYITTAKIHLQNPDKNAGYVYAEKVSVTGTKINFCNF